MMTFGNAGLWNNSQYEAIQQYVDIDALIDYMIVNFWIANDDWPQHNWYASRNRNGGQFRFQVWDAEHVLKNTSYGSTSNAGKLDASDANGPAQLHASLKNNAEYRLRFADRLQKHFFNDGLFNIDPTAPIWDPARPERNKAAGMYMKRVTEITNAIVAELPRTISFTSPSWLAPAPFITQPMASIRVSTGRVP